MIINAKCFQFKYSGALHSNGSIYRDIENATICARMGVDGILISVSRESNDLEDLSGTFTNGNAHRVF